MPFALLVMSGDEIVAALTRAGFRLVRREPGAVLLARGSRDVRVPTTPTIDEIELAAVLRASGVRYHALLDLLDEPALKTGDGGAVRKPAPRKASA